MRIPGDWIAILLVLVAGAAQQPAVLHITVTVDDAGGRSRPVPRHALLISDNPVTAAPQRVVTTIDGTADVRLQPGNYTIESDEPLILAGKSYQWAQTVDVVAGRETRLELTAANAMVEAAAPGAVSSPMNTASAASGILLDWQSSIVTIWTPKSLGAGFVIDARGLIATSQRLVGKATTVEVQLSSTDKVPGRVLAADANANVAIVWVDPRAIANSKAVKLAYSQAGKTAVAADDRVFAIEAPLHDRKTLASGKVTRVAAHTLTSDIDIDHDSAGVPLFDAAGDVVALTTSSDDEKDYGDVSARSVRIEDARPAIAAAEKQMQGQQPPQGTLPVEPERPFPDEALREAAQARTGNLAAYQVSASDFDVDLITPLLLYGVRHRGDRERGEPRNPAEMPPSLRALEEFGNWSDYLSDYPPVLLVRATPKLVEGFWTTVARGAASTQGISVPPIKKVKTTFGRLRLFCGEREVLPIHPFRIEHRIDGQHTIDEGLYVFDPGAVGPQCGTVKLLLYSEKTPEKADTRIVDAKIVQQVWDDFAGYRRATPDHLRYLALMPERSGTGSMTVVFNWRATLGR